MKTNNLKRLCQAGDLPGTVKTKTSLSVGLALAIGAALTFPMKAVVIDGFDGPVQKWLFSGGLPVSGEYLEASQTNGQLKLSVEFPVGVRDDNVYWPDPLLQVGELNGRTIELRMDLLDLTGKDHGLTLGIQMVGGIYLVARSQDQVGVVKRGGGRYTVLFWEDAPFKYTNTTVVLELAPLGDSLRVTARLLDKDNSDAVIYEHSFLDGPGSDVGILTNTPPGGNWYPDAGPPVMNVKLPWAGVAFLGTGTAPPAELVLDNLEYDLYDSPHLVIEKMVGEPSVNLAWSENTKPKQILMRSERVDGPWVVCPERIVGRGSGRLEVTARAANHSQYFKLAQGEWFTDEFTEGMKPGWEAIYGGQPAWSNYVSVEVSNDQFQVHVDPQPYFMGANNSVPYVVFAQPDLQPTDLSMSVDILAWDHSKKPTVALVAHQHSRGSGIFGLAVHSRTDWSKAVLWTYTSSGLNGGTNFVIDPAKQYRLVLTTTGGKFKLQLFDLADLTAPVSTMTGFDDGMTNGPAGLYFGDDNSGPLGGFDITVDNFFITGTKP